MNKKNKYFSFIGKNKKKVAVLAALMVCIGTFIAVRDGSPDKEANEDIPLHDEMCSSTV